MMVCREETIWVKISFLLFTHNDRRNTEKSAIGRFLILNEQFIDTIALQYQKQTKSNLSKHPHCTGSYTLI